MRSSVVGLLLVVHGACDDFEPVVAPLTACPATCDDDERCTDDRCDPTTFTCVHVPRDVQEACRQASHCDDGDACTSDTCAIDAECGFERCQHALVPDCRACTFGDFECDDGDACTVDRCGADFMCAYEVLEGCNSRCNVWTASSVMSTPVGRAQVVGMPFPPNGIRCDSGCTCETEVALWSPDAALTMRLTGLADASCSVDRCDGDYTCTPLEAGRGYIVYGNARFAAPGQPSGDLANELQVEGYCLSLFDGLGGDYDGVITLDGHDPITFRVTASPDFSSVTFEGTQRLAPNFSSTGNGGFLDLWFLVDAQSFNARLFPGRNGLSGPVYDPNRFEGGDADVPENPFPNERDMLRVGTIDLTLR